jgi:hypothetical protein
MKIFLSYPHEDTHKAVQLKDALFQGGQTVWMDNQLITGQEWQSQLEARIKEHEAIVLALTPNWIDSPYCQWEFITAVENGKKIIPVMLEKTALPTRISQYQYADFTSGFTDYVKVQRFLDDMLKLAVKVDKNKIASVDKEFYAMKIDRENSDGGHNINTSGTGNTVAGGKIDRSRQDIRIGGSVSGGNVNIGGTQNFHGNVNINYNALSSIPSNLLLDDLKSLLQELETALKQQSADKAEDVELIQEYANEIAEEAAKELPRKKKLEIMAENLMKAAKNLLNVSPIAAKIVQKLLMIG